MEEILHQGEQSEKDYDWLGAAELYKKALGMLSEDDFLRRGDVTERLGHAFYRAAFQAESNKEFRDRMRQSTAAYRESIESYGRLDDPAKKPRASRCNAMVNYIGYWLAPEAPEKKRLLQESWRSTRDSLEASKTSGEAKQYGQTYNLLSTAALLRHCFEWDYQARKEIIRELAEHGEAGIKLLSTVDETEETAKACARTAFAHSLFAFFFVELDQKEKYLEKAQSYWTKAKEASEDSAMLEMLCPIPCAHDLLWGFGSQEVVTKLKRALELGRRTRDKFIIGSALDWLAYHTTWATGWIDDNEEMANAVRTAIQYAEDAKRYYSIISFTSPRADNAWIEAIHAQLMPGYYGETDLGKRRDLLERAIVAGREALEPAEASGYPYTVFYVHLNLSSKLLALAEIEYGLEEKKKLLEEALPHANEVLKIGEQLVPMSYWDLGVCRGTLALIKCALADLTVDAEAKKSMLEAATQERESALKLMIKDANYRPEGKMVTFAVLGRVEYSAGLWRNRLYGLTSDKEYLRRAAQSFRDAVESFQRLNLVSRIAECYWKTGQTYDALGDHLKAAQNFHSASDNYRSAAEKIPQLKSFYEDHAVYMQAWTEIENARHHHERQEYDLAKEHFEKAAQLHKSLKKWSYLTSNYCAWSSVEGAEDLSRKEQCEEAIQTFEQAAKLFHETKSSIRNEIDKIDDPDEKRMADGIVTATDLRSEYCLARISLEEAKILDKNGDHYFSSEKYGHAAEAFEKISRRLETDQERKEFNLFTSLSHAWQKMTQAEAEASPTLYAEAAQLFEGAKEYCANEQAKMLVLGHSRFCKALEEGTRFMDTRDTTIHATATKYLESASNYYMNAGFQKASEYAKATQLLFDAYAQMDNARRESDPEKKAKLYAMTGKVLQTSAGCFMKAEHPEKRERVLRLLNKVEEERELASALTEVLHAPSIVSSTAVFRTPTPTREEAVGSERFESADIQANLIVRQRELKIGEPLNLEMELVNAGKGPALLVKVNKVIPEGFDLDEKPEPYRVEDSYIDMKGKRLGPLKTEELRLVLKPKVQGTFALKPTILYLDENGKYKSHEPESVTITVKELGIKGWLKGER